METVSRTLPNNQIIAEVIRLLNEGQRVTLPVKGYSMLPFIIGGIESVELVKPKSGQIAKGDIVLAWINNTHYVVHRVVDIQGGNVYLMGDGNLVGNEHCTMDDVAALAEYVIDRHGRKHYLYTRWRVLASHLWWSLRPLRRWILAVYRRTLLKFQTI